MNVLDSSGWLEFLANGPNAEFFAPAVSNVEDLIVPSIAIYEVFKRVLQQRGQEIADETMSLMYQGHVIALSAELAVDAAVLSSQLKLPMADSIILATSSAYNATLWTQDADFESIPAVNYIPKK